MQLLELTLGTTAENLALDEALLELCNADMSESTGPNHGVLRFWELPSLGVVVGRATKLREEVNVEMCRELDVPIYRRVSGGMSIVAGPGCLMYTIVAPHPPSVGSDINAIHNVVLQTLARPLIQTTGRDVTHVGTSDLAIAAADGTLKKFSGNSLRMARNAFLYHGTLLYDFDLSLISKCLKQPPRSPNYRQGRLHSDFVTNISTPPQSLRESIANAWDARDNLVQWPETRTAELVAQRYSLESWNRGR